MSSQPPTEQEVQTVMKTTGMDYLQARNHLLGRANERRREVRFDARFPVGADPVEDHVKRVV